MPVKYRKQVEARLRRLPGIIRDRREALGLTQEGMAESLEISIDTMKAIESGRRVPSIAMLIYFCLYLNIDMKFETR